MRFVSLNFRQLYNMCNVNVKTKANKSNIYGIKPSNPNSKVGDRRFSFLVRSTETYSSPGGHIASVVYPKVLELKDVKPTDNPMNRNIRLHCSCPAFLFWGTEWLSGQNKYNLEPATHIPANIRDPQRNHWLCKHLVRVCNWLLYKSFKDIFNKFRYSSLYVSKNSEDIPLLAPRDCIDSYIQALKDSNTYTREAESTIIANIDSPELDDILVDLGIYCK